MPNNNIRKSETTVKRSSADVDSQKEDRSLLRIIDKMMRFNSQARLSNDFNLSQGES